MKYELRDYQQEASDSAVRFFNTKNRRNGILVLPTGAGKSLVIADIASKLTGNVLVFQPSKEILEQNFAKLKSYGVDDCSIYSASFNSKEISRITFATIGSVISHSSDFNHFRYIIIDESHLVNATGGMYRDFFDCADRKILGLTATPYRLNASRISLDENGRYDPEKEPTNKCILKFLTRTRPRIFHDVIYQVGIQTLLARGYLAKLNYYDLTILDQQRLKRNSTGMDFDDNCLQLEFEQLNFSDYLVSIIKRLQNPHSGQARKGILVFTKFLEESEELCKRIDGCEMISGSTSKKERERILREFKAGNIPVVANVGVLTCLSEDTQILTRNKGWVGVSDLEYTDLIAQWENGLIDFAEPLRIIRKDSYDDDFVELNGPYLNLKVTHDHKMVYGKRGRKRINLSKAKASELVGKPIYLPVSGDALPDNIVLPELKLPTKARFVNWNSYNYRQRGYTKEVAKQMATDLYDRRLKSRCKAPTELSLKECMFIGFWIGDGSIWKSPNQGYRYSLCQSTSNPKMIEWLENLLDDIGVKYTRQEVVPSKIINERESNCSNAYVYSLAKGTGGNKQYVETTLTQLIPYLNKKGTDLFWGLNKQQFFSLMEGFFMANGEHGNNDRRYSGQRIVSANKELLDLLQAIGVCRGFRVTINECCAKEYSKVKLYTISMRKKTFHQLVNHRLKMVANDRKELVWCVTMPKGTIITRRNGKVTIMGNCGFDYPELDTVVMARPTMSLAMWYQIVGRAIRPYPGKEGWIVDLCGNIKRFGKVENLYLVEPKPGEYMIRGNVNKQDKQITNIYF